MITRNKTGKAPQRRRHKTERTRLKSLNTKQSIFIVDFRGLCKKEMLNV